MNRKIFFTGLFLLASFLSFSQNKYHRATPIAVIERIFNEYKSDEESTDSKDNKEAMTKAFHALQSSLKKQNLNLLINVWMYYDPTDFPTRSLLEPLFLKDKKAAVAAIDKRILHKMKWEDRDSFSDLRSLRATLVHASETPLTAK